MNTSNTSPMAVTVISQILFVQSYNLTYPDVWWFRGDDIHRSTYKTCSSRLPG